MVLLPGILRNFYVSFILFSLSYLINPCILAQSKVFTLGELMDSAQAHYPVLLQKRALIQSAKYQVQDARHRFLPNSIIGDEFTAGTNNSIPGSYLSFGIIPSSSSGVRSYNTYQPASGNIGYLYNDYELVNFGLKKSNVQYAQSYYNLSESDLRKEIYQLKWNIGQFYIQAIKAQSQLGIDLENIKRYEKVYAVIQALAKAGIKPGADSSLALAELSKTKITYNQNLGQFNNIIVQLGFLSGISFERIRIDSSRIKGLRIQEDLSNSQVFSREQNPLIDFYLKELNLNTEREHLIRKSFLPKILLSAVVWARGSSIDYTNNFGSIGNGFGFERYNYLGSIHFSYNLWNLIHSRDKASIAHYETMASQYRLEEERLNIKNVENLSEVGISTALKNLDEIPIQIQAAGDAFRQKTAQYKAGIINLVDLTNASYVLYRAQSDYVQAKSDWLLAHLDQAAAQGNLDQFIQNIQ